ncbi:MAG: rhodanese-like domain-containing protein [Saprospiraceae bacterium]
MKNIFIFITCISLIYSCKPIGSSESTATEEIPGTEYKNLDLRQFMVAYLSEKMDSAMILDLRTPPEFDEGYIKGAILINYLEKDIDHQLSLLDKSRKYYIYCEQGNRSSKCMEKMKGLGFTRVYNLIGGYQAYKKATFK